MIRPRTPLFDAATDAPLAGGSSPETPAIAVSTEKPKASIIAQGIALLKGANATAIEHAQLRADLTARDATIAEQKEILKKLDAHIVSLMAEISAFKDAESELKSTIETMQKEKTTVQTEVIAQLAASGVAPEQLPSRAHETAQKEEMTFEQFEALDHMARNAFFRRGGKLIGRN